MTTNEIITELEAHLAEPENRRDPRKSEQLMGYAMIQLKRARDLVRDTALPPRPIPPGAIDTKHDAALREFLR